MSKPFLIAACAGAVALASALGARAQSLTLHTLAGNAATGATNGYGSNARFSHPMGLTADAEGNIYVADTENSTIRKVTPDGFASTLAGAAGQFGSADGAGAAARFYGPQGVAADSGGNLYVADTANATIRKIAPDGSTSTLAGSPGNPNSFDGTGSTAQFYQPEGVAVDGAGNLYVADAWNHTIRKLTPSGAVSTLAGLAGQPGAADGTNSKARFNRPSSIALDAATNLFVTDALNHTIRQITPAGRVTTIAGRAGVWGSADGTNSGARFYHPQGIVAESASSFLVADSGNQTLRRVAAVGADWVVTTVAGGPGLAGNTNGTGNAARLCFPAGLGAAGAGETYVVDSGNHLLRTTRIVPPTLQFATVPGGLLLTWPNSSEGFALQSSPLLGPGASWAGVPAPVVNLGDNFGVTNSTATAPALFYRLRQP